MVAVWSCNYNGGTGGRGGRRAQYMSPVSVLMHPRAIPTTKHHDYLVAHFSEKRQAAMNGSLAQGQHCFPVHGRQSVDDAQGFAVVQAESALDRRPVDNVSVFILIATHVVFQHLVEAIEDLVRLRPIGMHWHEAAVRNAVEGRKKEATREDGLV